MIPAVREFFPADSPVFTPVHRAWIPPSKQGNRINIPFLHHLTTILNTLPVRAKELAPIVFVISRYICFCPCRAFFIFYFIDTQGAISLRSILPWADGSLPFQGVLFHSYSSPLNRGIEGGLEDRGPGGQEKRPEGATSYQPRVERSGTLGNQAHTHEPSPYRGKSRTT